MKKRIVGSLCAAAVVAFASVSWGAGFLIENTAQEMVFNGTGTLVSQASNIDALALGVGISASVDGGSINPLFNQDTYDDGGVMIQAVNDVVPDPLGTSAETPYALAGGFISVNEVGRTAAYSSVASFTQIFDIAAGQSASVSGVFEHFWTGNGYISHSKFTDRWAVYAVDQAGNLGQLLEETLLEFVGVQANNGEIGLLSPFATATYSTAGRYAFVVEAGVSATNPVPEPGTFILAGSGLVGLIALRRRNRKQA